MPPAAQTAIDSWSPPIGLTITLILTAIVYARGWMHLRRASPGVIPGWRLAAFLGGLALVWIAIGSPLAAFDDDLLTVHMVQHVLLMAIAPPLLLLGSPEMPLLHGLPQGLVRGPLGSLMRSRPLQRLGQSVTHPVFGLLSASLALIVWHIPAVFELALRSEAPHVFEHTCFFLTGIFFWWPVVQPWPSVARWPRWSMPLYLFLATLPCDALSAFLAFCERVVYGSYLDAPRLTTLSALEDQQCAAALMWVCATFIYLIPAVVITVQLLSPPDHHFAPSSPAGAGKAAEGALECGGSTPPSD